LELTYIYAMIDPRTGECRDVGKANDSDLRYGQHLTTAKRREETYKGQWLAAAG
jgi:hypothetical protein